MTVRVTTCLTLTGRYVPDRGDSKYLVFPSIIQSAGEKGERMALLFGESVAGEYIGDCGMRSLRREVGVRPVVGRMKGEGGTRGAEEALRIS